MFPPGYPCLVFKINSTNSSSSGAHRHDNLITGEMWDYAYQQVKVYWWCYWLAVFKWLSKQTNTNGITLTNHNRSKHHDEPIRIVKCSKKGAHKVWLVLVLLLVGSKASWGFLSYYSHLKIALINFAVIGNSLIMCTTFSLLFNSFVRHLWMNLGRPYVLYMFSSGTDSSWGNVQSLKYLGGMHIKAFKLAILMTSQMSLSPWYDDSS